ncbi:hypothetical protein DMC01_02795 [Campylobacter troglodytis]|nr:hypothetical protein DMC01_02795 [Campylobacter troglodytis]
MFLSDARLVYIPESAQIALKNSVVNDFFPKISHIKSGENDNFKKLLSLNANFIFVIKIV